MDWFKIMKGVRQGCMLSPCLFNFYTSCEMPDWMNPSWNQDIWETYKQPQICRRYNFNGRKWRGLKSFLMKVEKQGEKAGLKLDIQKTKIMASSPITSWQIHGEKWKQWYILFSWAPKSLWTVTAAMKLKDALLGRKAMTNLDNVLKSRDTTLPLKVHIIKAMVFPIVMYGCESWTMKKAEHWRIDAFEPWCWRRLLRVSWTARRSKQSILREINPEYSLEGLMLKLKLQSFGHLMWRADSLEKALGLGKIEGRRRRGR